MSFQKSVNLYNPLAVEGDYASANPRASVPAGESGLVAGPLGVTVGRFAWLLAAIAGTNPNLVTNYGEGAVAPAGFVHREQQALITAYLAEGSNLIPSGFGVTLASAGDFFAKVNGSPATPGAAVYASLYDGSVWIGAPPAGATGTGSIGSTFTATGAAANLTVTAVTGFIGIGDTISGTGVPAGTVILSQTSGAPNGAGVYVTSNPTTAAAATVTSFGNILNLTAVATGTFSVGDAVTGTGVPANATIASQVSGAVGGIGIYTLNVPATAYAASTALTVVAGILTKFVCKSVAAVGELVKISTW